MTQITLNIEDDKLKAFIAFIKTLNYVTVESKSKKTKVQEEDFVVPQDHKELILSRRKDTARKDYLPLSTLDNEVRLSK